MGADDNHAIRLHDDIYPSVERGSDCSSHLAAGTERQIERTVCVIANEGDVVGGTGVCLPNDKKLAIEVGLFIGSVNRGV